MRVAPFVRAQTRRRDGSVLKRLRRRLIITIMVLVGLVMLGVIAISSANAQASFDVLVDRSLDRVLGEGGADAGELDDDQALGMEHLPVLWIDFTAEGFRQIGTNQSKLTIDSDALSEAVTAALNSDKSGEGESEGRIESAHLTWRTASTPNVVRVAVADTSNIDAARDAQIVGDLRLAAGGMVILFVIANVLSHLLLAPVERAWEQQQQFIADASHELKTPLSVILANTEILNDATSGVSTSSLRWVESTAEEAKRMKGLVESLLELARTEEGASETLHREDVELSGIVEKEALQFDAVAFEQDCTISTDVAEGLHVMGNPDQLERLVKTLLDNACKYAAAGSVVEVSLTQQNSTAVLSVANYGTPIDPDDLPHVFDRFYRSDKARARETGGFGLGLAIAKGIVESHGGKISATSSEADATRFCVRLPLASR